LHNRLSLGLAKISRKARVNKLPPDMAMHLSGNPFTLPFATGSALSR
jgi:hypothetical protein